MRRRAARPAPPRARARDRLLPARDRRTGRRSSTAGRPPASTRSSERLRERGLELTDVRHLLLSHIHLDHAGATGVLVREHPGLQVHVSEVGAPHLVDPSKLIASATRLYGDELEPLWGEIVAGARARTCTSSARGVLGLDCFPSPGHASHHVCYLDARRDALRRRRGRRPDRRRARSCSRPRRRPTWTSRPGTRRSREIRAPLARAARADPLRRLRRRRAAPRRARAAARRVGRARVAAAPPRPSSSTRCSPSSIPRPPTSTRTAMPLEQSYAGLRRYVDKRAADKAGGHP